MVVPSGGSPAAPSSGGEIAVLPMAATYETTCGLPECHASAMRVKKICNLLNISTLSSQQIYVLHRRSGESEAPLRNGTTSDRRRIRCFPDNASVPIHLSRLGAHNFESTHGCIMDLAVKLAESSVEDNVAFVEELEEVSESVAYGYQDSAQEQIIVDCIRSVRFYEIESELMNKKTPIGRSNAYMMSSMQEKALCVHNEGQSSGTETENEAANVLRLLPPQERIIEAYLWPYE